MKKWILLAFVLLPVLLSGQILKGTGISYFDSIPNVAPSLPKGTEIALGIKTKKLYRWDRTCSCWIELETSTDSLARTVLASGLFNEYAVPFGGSTGKLDQSEVFKFVLGQLQANSFATLGSAGVGYVGLAPQSSVPATPASGIRVYADASGRFGWIGTNGYTRVFDASGITANRIFRLQNKTYTLADSADVASLSTSLPSAYFPLPGGTLTGTGGAGFVGFPAQSSAPSAPGAGFRIFANGAGNMGVIRADGYVTTFDFSTATGNRFFTYPANAGTFGILENTQTWTGVNTFAPTGTGGAGFSVSTTSRFATIAPTMTDAQAAAITGQTAGGWVYSTTQQRPYVHNGTAFQGVVLGPQTGFSSGQITYGGIGGNLTSNANFSYNATTNQFQIGMNDINVSTGSGFAQTQTTFNNLLLLYGPLQTGQNSFFSVGRSGWGRPGATQIGIGFSPMLITGYDTQLFFGGQNGNAASAWISSAGLFSTKIIGLGLGTGPNNTSRLLISASNVTEYNQAASYPSGDNHYYISTNTSGPGVATNTGQLGVAAGLKLTGRWLSLDGQQGVRIGTSTLKNVEYSTAALDIASTNKGLLIPRLASSSNISAGIGSVTVTNGGSGYGTGSGVTITISGGGGSGAAIGLTYSGGIITAATVLLKGSDYTSAPTITISGGTGSGATLTCTLESIPNGLFYYNTNDERIHLKRPDGFYSVAYTQDIKRDTVHRVINNNIDLSGLTSTWKSRSRRVTIETIVTAAATASNTIILPVPTADLVGIRFDISVEDTSGDSDISVLSFGTDGSADGYLYNSDGTYSSSQNLFPGLGVYLGVYWCEAKSAYRWKLQ